MIPNENNRISAFDLERQARQMQSEAVARGMRSMGRWIRGAFGG